MRRNIKTKRLLFKCVDRSRREFIFEEFQLETPSVFRDVKIQKDLKE